jgi:hypothetical protein
MRCARRTLCHFAWHHRDTPRDFRPRDTDRGWLG